jgi:hypothetical protein
MVKQPYSGSHREHSAQVITPQVAEISDGDRS